MRSSTLLLILLAMLMFGCGSTIPNRSPIGERFPEVQGTSLAGQAVSIPQAFKGQRVIIVVGYDMDTQFDIDRWGIGFFTADLELPPVYELPTIPGAIPSLFEKQIDAGMRKGIPEESWKDVITVYGGEGKKIARWTGTENPRNARVILLDEQGMVLWFHDRGYGLPPLSSLMSILREPKK